MDQPGGFGQATLLTKDPKLYFPHLGGIQKYFLNGIQSLIRPKAFSAKPVSLSNTELIPETSQANEYLSWYLQGTVGRSEENPLDMEENCIGETTGIAGNCGFLPSVADGGLVKDSDPSCVGFPDSYCWVNPLGKKGKVTDRDRLITLTGPLNKLLSQHIQWRNLFDKSTNSGVEQEVSRVAQASPRAKESRHNQVVGCTIGYRIPIPFFTGLEIGGFPVMCKSQSQETSPAPAPSGSGAPSSGSCPSVPDSAINATYLQMKDNYKRMAATYGSCDLVDECYNYVVDQSDKAGVNVALSLTLWLHESGASSYCTNPGVEDFGVHTIPGEDVVGQLAKWLEIAKASASCSWCYAQGGWTEPMQAFLYNYRYGGCNSSGDKSFYYNMRDMYQWVCDPVGSCLETESDGSLGFGISCPNDNSCPKKQ
jgi:hypothetical protein